MIIRNFQNLRRLLLSSRFSYPTQRPAVRQLRPPYIVDHSIVYGYTTRATMSAEITHETIKGTYFCGGCVVPLAAPPMLSLYS